MSYDVMILEGASDFILHQPVKMKAKIQRTIDMLKQYGYRLSAPYSKRITGTNGLYELRVKVVSDICRLFYFHVDGRLYVITSGYVKKSNKLNKDEVHRAITLMTRLREQLK